MRRKHLGRYPLQIETLAPRQYGDWNLVHLGRGEQEFNMPGRFLQGLQQRIECVFRQHMHFVDDVNFVARGYGRIAHRFNNLTHIVNTGVACGVHFDNVNVPPLGDSNARFAGAAGINSWPTLPVDSNAVQRFSN